LTGFERTTSSDAGAGCGSALLEVEFCGERRTVPATAPFTIGAVAELSLDVPPSLPDRLLQLRRSEGLWLMEQLVDGAGVHAVSPDGAWMAPMVPGRVVPLVFGRQVVRIAARGTYELELFVSDPVLRPQWAVSDGPVPRWSSLSVTDPGVSLDGGEGPRRHGSPGATYGAPEADPRVRAVRLTTEQRLLLAVLAAPVLRHGDVALSEIPSSVQASLLLGWPVTKFNRKLDTVCARLGSAGFGGLHGGSNRPALNRRTRLVQIAVAAGLVGPDDLRLLDSEGAPA